MSVNQMPVISLHVEAISRGKGRSVVQLAAYCAREKFYCRRTGQTYDHRGKKDLVYHEVMLPENAPKDFRDSETLWNAVEDSERNKNARLARSIIIALPKEFDRRTQIPLVHGYVSKYFVERGMCADIFIHDKGDGNPHAHVLLTTRSLDEQGRWMSKQHRNYLLDETGNRIFDPEKKKYMLGKSIKTNDWDEWARMEEWRKGWADACNYYFRLQRIRKVLSHKSYLRQGSARKPTIHLGAKASAMKKQGILTEKEKRNQQIRSLNISMGREENERLREFIKERLKEHDIGRERS